MALTTFIVPVVNIPQTFEIDLAGTTYNLTCKWNPSDDAGWVLDFATQDNVSIIANLPLITGCNILEGLQYLGIGGTLTVLTDGDIYAVPTLDNLGKNCNLLFLTDVPDNG